MIRPYKPNPKNLHSLAKWFKNFSFLTDQDLARMAEMSVSTIRRWRRKTENKTVDYRKPFKRCKSDLSSEVWNHRQWFDDAYNGDELSVRQIAKKIGRSIGFVQSKLKRYRVPLRPPEESNTSKNSCCSYEWLDKHYTKELLTLAECADLAGVKSPRTILVWLAKFDIESRNPSEGQHAKWRRYEC